CRPFHLRPAHILLCAGTICLTTGQIDEASSHVREVLALARRLEARGSEAHALCLAGDVASTSCIEVAEAYYCQALTLAEPRGMRPLIAHCYLGLGKLYRRKGNRERALEQIIIAMSMYREMGMQFWLEQAAAEIPQLQ